MSSHAARVSAWSPTATAATAALAKQTRLLCQQQASSHVDRAEICRARWAAFRLMVGQAARHGVAAADAGSLSGSPVHAGTPVAARPVRAAARTPAARAARPSDSESEEQAPAADNRLFREPSDSMPVGLFTKPLCADAHWRGMTNLGLGRFRDGPPGEGWSGSFEEHITKESTGSTNPCNRPPSSGGGEAATP